MRISICAVLCFCIFTIVGCGGGASDAPELAPVTGKVTVAGEAVSGGTITFVPDNSKGTTGPSSAGEITADGTYTVYGPGGEAGAVVGSHKVTIICAPDPGEVSGGESSSEPYKCIIPARYGDVKLTDLTAEVKQSEAGNTVDLDLKKK